MQRLQHGLRMRFRHTQQRAGGTFGAAVALFPVLESTGADADKSCELNLAQAEFLTHRFGIGPLQGGAARRFLFPAKDGTAFLEAGGELLEEFVFHGNSVSMGETLAEKGPSMT